MEKQVLQMLKNMVGYGEFDKETLQICINEISKKTGKNEENIVKIIKRHIRMSSLTSRYYIVKKSSRKNK